MDIIKRNFFRILQNTVFGMGEEIEPMSKYKWNVLAKLAETHGLGEYFADRADIPVVGGLQNLPDAGFSRMQNLLLNSRLKKIRKTEPFSEDSSIETLNFLDIIVQTTQTILTNGLHFANIVRIGDYLRKDGDKIDFIKLEKWLSRLQLAKIAQLEASILIQTLGFELDEIPFITSVTPQAYDMAIEALDAPIVIKQDEWQFHNSGIFVSNNSKAMRKTFRNYKKYFFYAPVEVASCCVHRFENSISTIEE